MSLVSWFFKQALCIVGVKPWPVFSFTVQSTARVGTLWNWVVQLIHSGWFPLPLSPSLSLSLSLFLLSQC